jgi:hypothetical protein
MDRGRASNPAVCRNVLEKGFFPRSGTRHGRPPVAQNSYSASLPLRNRP